MKENILFIQGIYDTIDLFIADLSAAFEELGDAVYILDVREKDTFLQKLWNLLEEPGIDAVVTFNNIGYNLSFSEGKNIWEEKNIPDYNILMDHPFHYDQPLRHAPKTSRIFCTDRNHVAYLKRFYPELAHVDFLPHAGMEADISRPSEAGTCYLSYGKEVSHPCIKERQIDVLYAGSLSKYVAEGLVPDLGEIQEYDAFALTQEVLKNLIQNPYQTTEDVVETYFQSIGIQYSDDELCRQITKLRFLDSFATSYYREQSVRLLVEHGIKVAVFGGGWDQCEWADNPNLLYGGKVLAPQVLELMNHSKIVLNTMTWYKNGIHDRIINGMLAKSVVVTDTSQYLKEEQKKMADTGFVTFELPEIQHLPGIVEDLLQQADKMQAIADCGYLYAKNNHTWIKRAEYLKRTR